MKSIYEVPYFGCKITKREDITSEVLNNYTNYIKKYPMWYYIDNTISEYNPFDKKYDKKFYELAKFLKNYNSYKRPYKCYGWKWEELNENQKYQCMLYIKWRWVYCGYVCEQYDSKTYLLNILAGVLFPHSISPFYDNTSLFGYKYVNIFREDYLTKVNPHLNKVFQIIIDNKEKF